MTESQERFVRAVLERLPASRVVEMHLFPALRQGGTETGVAVIAARRAESERAEGAESERAEGERAEGEREVSIEVASEGAPAGGAGEAEGPPPRAQATTGDETDHHQSAAVGADSAPADVARPEDAEERARPAERGRRARTVRPARRVAQEPGERHTVFTARYRLTIRGPERGRWEFDLVEEADAPLVTVDAVVRGVQERAGEGGEPERLGPDALAALAAGPGAPWTSATR